MTTKYYDFLIKPMAIAVGVSVVLLILRAFALRALSLTGRRHRNLDAAFVDVIRIPSICVCFAIGIYVGNELTDLPVKLGNSLSQVLKCILVLSVTVAVANLAGLIFKNFVQKAGSNIPSSGLVVVMLRGSILLVGFLVILSILGISIAPILTALGVGGLAVALALKDTLENFFAGIHLLTDRAIVVGNFIRLEGGQEGLVQDIGWRTARIKLNQNNLLIIPNSKLAQSIVINYSLPDKRVLSSISVSLVPWSDPRLVEETLMRTCLAGTEDITGLLSTPSPVVRFNPGPANGAFEFTLSFYVNQFSDQSFVSHELRKRLVVALREKGISFKS